MRLHTRNTPSNSYDSVVHSVLTTVFSVALCGYTDLAISDDARKYYETMLFNPSQAVLLAEANGRVTIYDGLDYQIISQALDAQFDRIEHMMFIRSREVLPDRSVEIDDDCD
ncbi:MAG: hypothetical protein N0E38_17295 [Candidatus Thiodiazotropha endolucinida]|nr:hypothetical protein [Candidatus Thiodiazotropha taylori]MCW4350686.1 hypothetical protein [Candidatus Thiodiazotropha endolucinida]